MILKELLKVIDNSIYVEIYNTKELRIAEDYPTMMLRYCDEKILNKKVRIVSCDYESTDANTDLQITVED